MPRNIVRSKPLLDVNNDTCFNIIDTGGQSVLKEAPCVSHFLLIFASLLGVCDIIDYCEVTTKAGHAISVFRIQLAATVVF